MNVSGVPKCLRWHWCISTWVLRHDLPGENHKTIMRILSWRNTIFRLWFLSRAGSCFHLYHFFLAGREKSAPCVSPLWAEFLVQTWEALAQLFPNHTQLQLCQRTAILYPREYRNTLDGLPFFSARRSVFPILWCWLQPKPALTASRRSQAKYHQFELWNKNYKRGKVELKCPSYSKWIPRNRNNTLLVGKLEVIQAKHIKISVPKFTPRTFFFAKLRVADRTAFVLDPLSSRSSH